MMDLALEAARSCRLVTSPNPWVGCVVDTGENQYLGATSPPGGNHAEINALEAAGSRAEGADLYTTLEPCDHRGRTGPCTDAIVAAGVDRVVVAVEDPDPAVSGRGIAALKQAGIEVEVGVRDGEAAELLAPYLKHRRTGLPWVVLKLAATLDGRTAAPDATSRWITGPEARSDVHRFRAESDAVLVGAGTVRADDPALTVRDWQPPSGVTPRTSQPLRVVLGTAPPDARSIPRWRWTGRRTRCFKNWGSEAWSNFSWKEGPQPRPPSTGLASWTITPYIWPRPCSGATMPTRCWPALAPPLSMTCGEAKSSGSPGLAPT